MFYPHHNHMEEPVVSGDNRTAPTERELPVSDRDREPDRAARALILAQRRGLVVYKWPLDVADPEQVARYRRYLGDDAPLPSKKLDEYYYLTFGCNPNGTPDPNPVLLPQSEAPAVMFGLAWARYGFNGAQDFEYRPGMLREPAPDTEASQP